MTIEIRSKNPMTNAIFTESKYSLNKQLQAVAIGLRSELLMFLINTEREMDIGK